MHVGLKLDCGSKVTEAYKNGNYWELTVKLWEEPQAT